MRRFWRRLCTPNSNSLASAGRVQTSKLTQPSCLTSFKLGITESGEDHWRPRCNIGKLLDFDSQQWPGDGQEVYRDLILSTSGHYLMRSAFTDRTGKRLGRKKVHVFVISPAGRVICEETNRVITYPKMNEFNLEGVEEKGLEIQIDVSQRALEAAFRKSRHADAGLQRKAKQLATLEAELAQTMKNIRLTKRQAIALREAKRDTRGLISDMRDVGIANMESAVRQTDPETFKKYSELKTSKEGTELLKDILHRLHSLEQLRELTYRKCATQRRQEKAAQSATTAPPRRQGDKGKVRRASSRGQQVGLVQQLVRMADARRRGELRPTVETAL